MAPYRKMTPKEIKLEQMPWVTRGILVSMRIRDTLYKSWNREKDMQFKTSIFTIYKRYHNMMINLLRRSKQNYYSLFFIQNQSNIKKTCDKCIKKEELNPTKLIYKNQEKVSNDEIAQSLNDFFCQY